MKVMSVVVLVAFLLTSLGCENMSRTEKTTLGGAAIGGAVGGLIGSKKADAGKGILIGSAVGALAGYAVGKMTEPKANEAPTVVCPYCKTVNELPAGAKAGSVVQCGTCGKNFELQ